MQEKNNDRGRDGGRDKHKTGRCAMGREGSGRGGALREPAGASRIPPLIFEPRRLEPNWMD